MSISLTRFRIFCILFGFLLLLPCASHLEAQQQDEGGGAPMSCDLTAGNSCPPTDGMGNVLPRSNTDINGDGKKDWRYPSTNQNNNPVVDDKGNQLEIWCIDGGTPWYALVFTPAGGGAQRLVGKCPFGGGCNSKWKFDDTDADGNGKPDCITKTVWISRDQWGRKPGEGPTGGDDDGDGNVDWYKYTYDVEKNEVWTECWQSKDGKGDGDYDGTDEPDVMVDKCHGAPKEGDFGFEDLKPEDPTVATVPVPDEEPVPTEEPTVEPTIPADDGAMNEIYDYVHLTGAAVGGVVGLELGGQVVEVQTQPGESTESIVARLADLLREHPKLSRYALEVDGAELRMIGAAPGELLVHCTDPGIPVPAPVQDLRGRFDPVTSAVRLSWNLPPGADLDRIHIYRDGVSHRLNRLPETTEFVDSLDLSMTSDAIHEYRIVAEKDGVRTATSVVVPVLFVREGETGLPDARVFDPR